MSTVKIKIDGQELEVAAGTTIIQAAHEQGINIPYYCYHPGMVPDGNCRVCLVEVEKAPKLVVSCKTPVADGMVVHTGGEKVEEGRKGVMEFMLVNHPIDCPVCDQAGECKLQDYYFDYDLQDSRFKESKVHKRKVVELGPNVMFDAERCIMCSRCVRFCRDVSETNELGLFNRGDRTEIGLAPGATLDNPYAMNVVDICPVGALTSRQFRFQKRVWFLEEQASTCPGCARGCAIKADFDPAQNRVYRIRAAKDLDVNGYWMCDDGRFTAARDAENRLLQAILPAGETNAATWLLESWQAADKHTIVVDPGQTNEVYERVARLRDAGAEVRVSEGLGTAAYAVEEDDFLISADKNPNRAGLQAILGEVPAWDGKAEGLVLAIGRDPGNLPAGAILLSPWLPASAVSAIPIASWWETDGTSTNLDGISRSVQAVLEPTADVLQACSWLGRLQPAEDEA